MRRYCILSGGVFYFEPPCKLNYLVVLQRLDPEIQQLPVLSCIDAVLSSFNAIVILQTGGVRAYFPWIPTDAENTTSETTPDQMAPVYSVNWISTTISTSSISYNSAISSAQIPLPNTTAIRNPPYDCYLIVGPMIYLNFSAANTTDAGFTVDLLFQHPSYFKASWLILLY